MYEADSFADLIYGVVRYFSTDDIARLAMVGWRLWKERNSRCWDGKSSTVRRVVYDALDFLQEWRLARVSVPGRSPLLRRYNKWHLPSARKYKCNIDVAQFHDSLETGMGMVICDDAGFFVVCRTVHFPGVLRSDEAEIMGHHEALSWLKNVGFEGIDVEMDAKVVVDAVSARRFDDTPFGNLLEIVLI
ncbi:hypothetical protein ACS0TY_027204 [Phlomoides rotata]